MKKIVSIILIAVLIFSLSSCGSRTATDPVEQYFAALRQLDFVTAGELLGDKDAYSNVIESLSDESYLAVKSETAFLNCVYGNLEYEITKLSDNEYEIVIRAYTSSELISYQQKREIEFTSSKEYQNMSTGEKYLALCDFEQIVFDDVDKSLTKVENVVKVQVEYNYSKPVIKVGIDFFNALAGIR